MYNDTTWGWDKWSAVENGAICATELSSNARAVYSTLCTFATPTKRYCWPKVATIAARIKRSVRTVQRGLRELEAAHRIETKRRVKIKGMRLTVYYLLGNEGKISHQNDQRNDEEEGLFEPPFYPSEDMSVIADVDQVVTTHMTDLSPKEVDSENKTYIPKGESESPSQDSQEHVEANNVTSHQSQEQHDSDQQKKTQLDKAQFSGKPFEAQAILTPDDAPHSMRPTAELFLMKTGRAGLTNADISAFRELNGLHTPARIQTEIYTQLKKFAAKGRPASSLNMSYIASVLRKQKPTFKPLSPGDDKTPEELAAIEKACRDLNACVITTPDDMTEEEAIAMMERTDALLREMGEL